MVAMYERKIVKFIDNAVLDIRLGKSVSQAFTDTRESLDKELSTEQFEDAERRLLIVLVAKRISTTPELEPFLATIFYDWSNMSEHLLWAATAPVEEIVDWAQSIEA